MAVTREIHKVIESENGLVFLELDWDYNDAVPQGQRLYGYRVLNGSQRNVVYRFTFQLDGVEQIAREVMPGEDTGMVSVGNINLLRGSSFRAFSFGLQPWRLAG